MGWTILDKKQYAYLLLLPVAIYLTTKFGYAHNITESLPYKHFFIVRNSTASKGDYILFNAPETCKYSEMKLVKEIVGVEGDQVLVEKDQVFINWVEVGIAKTHSKHGDVLTITQEQTIPKGKYYVATEYADSYDSRYAEFGLIDEKNIIGVAYPIW